MYMRICPVCKQSIVTKGESRFCSSGHAFDRAKEWYVNLLVWHTKKIWDEAMMVRARRDFLATWLYMPLVEKIEEIIYDKYKDESICIADFWCGEGRYLREIQRKRWQHDTYVWIDISKDAVKYCAKRTSWCFAVGSTYDVPLSDASCDVIVSIFSPFDEQEISRCLKTDGIAIIVWPWSEHLYTFIKMIRDTPHKHVLVPSEEKYSDVQLLNFVVLTPLALPRKIMQHPI